MSFLTDHPTFDPTLPVDHIVTLVWGRHFVQGAVNELARFPRLGSVQIVFKPDLVRWFDEYEWPMAWGGFWIPEGETLPCGTKIDTLLGAAQFRTLNTAIHFKLNFHG